MSSENGEMGYKFRSRGRIQFKFLQNVILLSLRKRGTMYCINGDFLLLKVPGKKG